MVVIILHVHSPASSRDKINALSVVFVVDVVVGGTQRPKTDAAEETSERDITASSAVAGWRLIGD